MRILLGLILGGVLGCEQPDKLRLDERTLAVREESPPARESAPAAPGEVASGLAASVPERGDGLPKEKGATFAPSPSWPPTNPEDTGRWGVAEEKAPAEAARPYAPAPVTSDVLDRQAVYLKAVADEAEVLERLPESDREAARATLKTSIMGF